MKVYKQLCDLCEKELGKHTNSGKHGFCSEIGYSLGGWGLRRDFVIKTSMEVCTECFDQLKEKSIQLNNTIEKLTKQ